VPASRLVTHKEAFAAMFVSFEIQISIHINEVKNVTNALSVASRTIKVNEDVRAGPWCGTNTGFMWHEDE
jgi:hypothetical protein